MSITIDMSEVDALANKVRRLSETALPNVVRETLNRIGLDIKKNEIPITTGAFVKRSPTFFKATSGVDFATGHNISTMFASVGFAERTPQSGLRGPTSDLEQQEDGGAIKNKTFIAEAAARIGGDYNKMVRSNYRLSVIKRTLIDAAKMTGKNKRERFAQAVAVAGIGGMVLGENFIWRVDSTMSSDIRTKQIQVKLTPLYSYRKNRSVHVTATKFMEKAANLGASQAEKIFYELAQKRLERALA